jgi:hypothetical protein
MKLANAADHRPDLIKGSSTCPAKVTPIGPLDDVAHPVYSLRLGGENSDQYYADVARFADELLAEVDLQAAALIAAYSRDLTRIMREGLKSESPLCYKHVV